VSIGAEAFSDGVLINVTREEISLMIDCLDAILVKAGAARRVA
jgi:acetylornithine/N-succinyldiaminopimelate aminotransferase